MFKKVKAKLLAGLTTTACVLAAFGVWAQAGASPVEANAEETAIPVTLTIESNNVSYNDSVYVLYAVGVEGAELNASDVKMLFWDSVQTEYTIDTVPEYDAQKNRNYVQEHRGMETVNGQKRIVFYSYGLAAREMTDSVYCRAYANVDGVEYYSEVVKYSVWQYTYEKSKDPTVTELQLAMFDAMLDYGTAAQNLLGYKTDVPANGEYTWVEVVNATLPDGFGYGMYKAGETLTVTPAVGYEFNAGNAAYTVDESTGAITLTVPTEDFVDEETFTAITTFTKTYTFADYPAGTQYALNEVHVLDEYVTVTTDKGHFTSELRLYSSSSNNATAIIAASNVIDSISFNAGNKVDALNIYGSVDGVTFTSEPIATVAVTSTSYLDYTVDVDENSLYKYLKLDVAGSNQVRIAFFTITIFNEGQEPQVTDEDKLNAAVNAFEMNDFTLNGGDEIELSTATSVDGVTVTWTEDSAFASIYGSTLSVENVQTTFTLTATFTCGEATVAKAYEIKVLYVADEQKVQNAADEFLLGFTKLFLNDVKELATVAPSDEEVAIVWSLAETDSATLEGNVLTAVAVGEIELTATFTCNGELSVEKTYAVAITDNTLTIPEALELGATFEKDNFTAEKYYVSGTITEVTNTEYGNMYIADEEGNKIYIYGLYDESGVKYNAMAVQPTEGYTIKVLSVVGMYTEVQLKSATLVEMKDPTDSFKVEAEANALTLVANVTGAKEIELVTAGKTFTDVTIEWTVTANGEIASITDGVLVIVNPEADAEITVQAAIRLGEAIEYRAFTIAVARVDEGGEAPAEPTTLARFEFGANGSASHNDGSEKTSYTETQNGYALSLTNGTKMYSGARDAKGNSCLKFGTSSAVGSMQFTVPENVTKVIIYVAKYKANTSKISINGMAYSLTKNSNDGAYDVIEVDTSSTKAVSFTTVSGGVRVMMNALEFIGIA